MKREPQNVLAFDQIDFGRQSVADIVYHALLDAIYEGVLAPGEHLNEAEYVERWGISRTPIREAVQRLKHIGLVVSSPNRYTRIVEIDAEQTRQALTAWLALYDALLVEVHGKVPAAKLRVMRKHSADAAKAAKRLDAVSTARHNFDFFNELNSVSTNVYLRDALDSVIHVIRLGSVWLPQWVDVAALGEVQAQIVMGLEAGDLTQARTAVRQAYLTVLTAAEQ